MSEFGYADDGRQEPAPSQDMEIRFAGGAPCNAVAEFDLARVLDILPKLGAVLWIERRRRHGEAALGFAPRCRLFLADPTLDALRTCKHLTAHSAVTPYGPREWLCFRDAADVTQSKLFLLPDTDYLAWEELVAQSIAPAWRPASAIQRTLARLGAGWRARVLRFDLRSLTRLRRLDARAPRQVSHLGLELASAIARAGHAEFLGPVSSA